MNNLLRSCLILILFVGLIQCDDVDLSAGEDVSVAGFWQKNSGTGDNTYLLIDYNSSSFNFYYTDVSENCTRISAYTLIREEGKGFFVVNRGDGSENIIFAVSDRDERIEIRRLDQSSDQLTRFFPATVTVDQLPPECINETDIQGNWEITINSERSILEVMDDSVTVIQELLSRNCYETVGYSIEGSNNNIYRLNDKITDVTTDELFVQMRRTVLGLEVSIETPQGINTDIYQESSTDLSTLLPVCDQNFDNDIEGMWEPTMPDSDQEPITHIEIKQDTLRFFYTATIDVTEPCIGKNDWLIEARRGNTFFFSDVPSSGAEFISEILLQGNELVIRYSENGANIEDRHLRSSATYESLKPDFCTETNESTD